VDTTRAAAHFVLLLSSAGIPMEDIAHLVGHVNTRTTEKVYRKELRPVLRRGAKAMDDLFNSYRTASEPPLCPPHAVRTKQSADMHRCASCMTRGNSQWSLGDSNP
jgi:nitrate reductase cytochrome c-type subunit